METETITLVAGRDYPNAYRSFVEMFPDEAACEAYQAKLRWPHGVNGDVKVYQLRELKSVPIPGRDSFNPEKLKS